MKHKYCVVFMVLEEMAGNTYSFTAGVRKYLAVRVKLLVSCVILCLLHAWSAIQLPVNLWAFSFRVHTKIERALY